MKVDFTYCRSCQAPIVWMVTKANKRIPVNADSVNVETLAFAGRVPVFNYLHHKSHFSTCPDAERWRRGGGQ